MHDDSKGSKGAGERIVMKRVKKSVQGGEEAHEMELKLNLYASTKCKGHMAEFIGWRQEVSPYGLVSPGLWLVWKFEGSKTLSHYLRRRDCLEILAEDLMVPEEAVVATVMKHLMEALASFHLAGLVHRDVKPLNMILSNDDHRFKLIDLGACADLRTGMNYVPNESILDPGYAPPEQFALPTDSPELSGLFSSVVSPVLWAQHKPDRFDTWSAGICMLQLALPSLRSDRGLQSFINLYGPRFKYDLDAWRKKSTIPAREFQALDADDGAGWTLLKELLVERSVQQLEGGGVRFIEGTLRLSASEALRYSFFKQARDPMEKKPVSSKADAFGQAVNVWKEMSRKMFSLESKLKNQVSATATQTVKVKSLQQKVKSIDGAEAKKAEALLALEQRKLDAMEKRVLGLEGEMKATAKKTTGLLGFLKGMSKGKQAPPPLTPSTAFSWDGSAKVANVDVKLQNQISAAEKQSLTIKKLQQKVEQGVVEEDKLRIAEKALGVIQNRSKALKLEKEKATPLASPAALAVTPPVTLRSPPPAAIADKSVQSKDLIDGSLRILGGFAARFVLGLASSLVSESNKIMKEMDNTKARKAAASQKATSSQQERKESPSEETAMTLEREDGWKTKDQFLVEQEQLKKEYLQMEQKLKEMEMSMRRAEEERLAAEALRDAEREKDRLTAEASRGAEEERIADLVALKLESRLSQAKRTVEILTPAAPPSSLDDATMRRLTAAYDKTKEGLAKAQAMLEAAEGHVKSARGAAVNATKVARERARDRVKEAEEVVDSAQEMLEALGVEVDENGDLKA